MSSHKEAPGIINDAAADNTDVYAFVSPDRPDTVTLIANYVPFGLPSGGPNFSEFGDDVLYEIHIDNNGDGLADIIYQFEFNTVNTIPNTFLYNVGPIETLSSKNWNRKQYVTVHKIQNGKRTLEAWNQPLPPNNVGEHSTPNYPTLAEKALHRMQSGGMLFAGARAEGFYVDLGAIFDLGILRPFLPYFLEKMPAAPGVNATKALNINTIAIQIARKDLTANGLPPNNAAAASSVIGVWATASRQKSTTIGANGVKMSSGPWTQVSRLGNPLFNEVINPISRKDAWNAARPHNDKYFADYVLHPELGGLLNVLYPGVFPNLAKYKKPRADLAAILLTGVPAGIIPGFQNYTGSTQADMLRLNMAIPPTTKKPSNLGILGGDLAGFPNGRRVFDDVTSIELRAIAGATIPLVDKSYKPDAAAGELTEGLTSSNTDVTADNTVHYQSTFPYLGTPHSGYSTPSK